jgi:xanthine dehydrogenase accessory factor
MDIFEKVVDAKKRGLPLVLLSVIDVKGSSPREIGARMILWQDGTTDGTIGGGAIEKEALQEAGRVFETREARVFHYDLTDLKMQCGGKMSVFIEPILPKKQLIIFGAGHIGLALSHIAELLSFSLTVVDDRSEFANEQRFPHAAAIICKNYKESFNDLIFKDSYIVIVTYKHLHDQEILEECVKHPFAYLGMIGSTTKVTKAFNLLMEKNVSKDILNKIHSPIGLDIGANTPEEIAVAIAAEMIAVKNGQDISSLTMKK